MQATTDETDPLGYLGIVISGLWLLALHMAKKLTPGQRSALFILLVTSGGAAISLLVYYQQVWLALVIMLVLGIAIGILLRM